MSDRRRLVAIMAVALAIYLGTAAFFDMLTIGVGADVGHYLILATSLGNGHGLSYVNNPAMPASTKFPFGFPFLLVPIVLAFPGNILAAWLFAVVVSLGAVVACYVYARRMASQWAIPITALFAFSVHTVSGASYPQSDLLFSQVLCLALAMSDVYAGDPSHLNRHLVATGVLTLSAAFIRVAGILMLPAQIVYLLIRRQTRKALWLALVVIIGYSPWALRNFVVTGSPLPVAYGVDFVSSEGTTDQAAATLAQRLPSNVLSYSTTLLPDNVTGIFSTQVKGILARLHASALLAAIGLVIFLILVYGMVIRIRSRGIGAAELFLALYLAVLLVDSFVDSRFVLPIVPILFVYFFEGLNRLAARFGRPAVTLRIVTVIILLIMAARIGAYYANGLNGALDSRDKSTDWVAWIKENTQPDALLITALPRFLSFRTGRLAIDYYDVKCTPESFLEPVQAARPVYVVLHPIHGVFTDKCISTTIRENAERFREVYQVARSQVTIYQVIQ